MTLFTIPASLSFIDNLVAGIMSRYNNSSYVLSKITLLLPTHRCCMEAQKAFSQHSATALLLPKIIPIAEMEEAELLLHIPQNTIPTAIGTLPQLMHLATLITEKDIGISDISQAIHLAIELTKFLAEMQQEYCNFDVLDNLVPHNMQEQWQHTLKLLHLLSHDWPAILTAKNMVDPTTRRNLFMAAQSSFWQQYPSKDPIIVAGIMGENTAIIDLLQTINAMPEGMVILPMLDKDMDAESWESINLCHPQWEMKTLLNTMGISYQQVQLWHQEDIPQEALQKAVLIREIMRPAAITDAWQSLATLQEESLAGISINNSSTLQQEAATIACIIRESLEQPTARIALITEERKLARRVSSLLKRWDIIAEDAASMPLLSTPIGVFLHLIVEMIISDAAPVPLLALLKHPLAAAGIEPWIFQQNVRSLEITVLRGVRVAPGLGGIRDALSVSEDPDLCSWFAQLEVLFSPFIVLLSQETAPFESLLAAHLKLAEDLASTHEQEGNRRLWEGDDGKQVAIFMTELLQTAVEFNVLSTHSYAGLFTALWSGKCYKPTTHMHPRISILSPKEARLTYFDTVILAGLTEGSWPKPPSLDPWLNRLMRKEIGLKSPEQTLGKSAHDLAFHFHAPRVILSWCDKIDGMPTVPSRWLLRLFTVLESAGLGNKLNVANPWSQWAEQLECPETIPPLQPPAPTPPLSSRPRTLSVTHIERWMRDPYALYISKILKLRALDPLDADPGMAEFGNFIHKALDQFNRLYPTLTDNNRYSTLINCGHQALAEMINRPLVKHFWLPRFERIAAWIIHFEQQRRHGKTKIFSEMEGTITLGDTNNPFILKAKADRLELNSLGEMTIIDYKTGTAPTQTDVKLGTSPQLTLEALIAEHLGFNGVKTTSLKVKDLLYIRLTGGEEAGEIHPIKEDISTLSAAAKIGLETLIIAFDKLETAYLCCPRPEKVPNYNDYLHLSRIKEWRNTLS